MTKILCGRCPVCHRWVQIAKGGRLVEHGKCSGSGQKPR